MPTSSSASKPIQCPPQNILKSHIRKEKWPAKIDYSNFLDVKSMVLTLFRGGRLYFHDVSSMFTYHINRSNEVWAYVEDVNTTIDGYRPYFDFWNMMIYDLQCHPPRAYKVDDDYFEDIDLNSTDCSRISNKVLLDYICNETTHVELNNSNF